jgi:hypothetical protein
MTSKRSNQRNAFGQQTEDKSNASPKSHRFEGRRSANEAGDAAINRPNPGKALASSRLKKNERTKKD